MKINLGRVKAPMWYNGSAVEGNSTEPVSFDTGINPTYPEDLYLNTNIFSESVGNIYRCVKGGNGKEATWVLTGSLQIAKSALVVDALNSMASDQPLSANQGRILYDMIKEINTSPRSVQAQTTTACGFIGMTIDDTTTDIIVTDTNGNSNTFSYQGRSEETVDIKFSLQGIGFSGPKIIESIVSSRAGIHKYTLYDASNQKIVEVTPSIWESIMENDRNIEYGGSTQGKSLAAFSKIINGSRTPLFVDAASVLFKNGLSLQDSVNYTVGVDQTDHVVITFKEDKT